MQDYIFQLQAHIAHHIMAPDRIPVAIAAILLVSLIGFLTGPAFHCANPFIYKLYDFLFGITGDRLDKTARPANDLMLRGFLMLIFVLFMTGAFAKLAELALDMSFGFDFLIEIVILAICISSGAIWLMLLRLNRALKEGKSVQSVYLDLSRSSRVNLNSIDNFGITRTALGYLAISFDKFMVTPVFWYILGGLAPLLFYISLEFMVWRFGKSGFSKGFGRLPIALEKLMGYVPSLFAGFIITFASALTPTAKMHKSILAWWSVKDKTPYEQGGIGLAAMAWPLNIVIGGPVVDISGSSIQSVWVGPQGATAQVDHNHIRRALYLIIVAHLLYVFILLSAYIYAVKVF